ncbi:GntR family transcriptional regulator [Streptomyces sp. NPDC047974]|uniref:GntR family transcriptional regulator n=1 Tax=Streptomyces sp. NPDC047974 TaxID=3154343 RepID=UPI0033D7B0C9
MNAQTWAGRLPVVKSKADLVYDSLRAAIASGELRPGERINMEELGRTFGVSKIPVREAVKRLESENLLTSRVHTGMTVTEVDPDEIRGVYLARQAIEGLVARLAAEGGDALLVDDLTTAHEAMLRAMEEDDEQALSRLNTEFHRRIAAASGYRVLADVTEQLLLTIQRYRLIIPRRDADWRSVLAEHEAVIEALRTGGPDAVADAARTHTTSQARREAEARR